MSPYRYKYLSPADAARVGRLQFFARQVVEGVITGLHKSPHRGFSAEFSEHREYSAGDELRHLDWRVYGRSDRYYVKLYEQETNLRAMLVLDNSASMAYGGKLEYSRHLAACLAYLLSRQQDLAGLCAMDESLRVELPAASSSAHLDRLFKELEQLQPGATTELPRHLHTLAQRLPRRSMVILISDLWMEPDELFRAIQHLRYRKHQVMVIHLLHQDELTLEGPTFARQLTLEDMETREKLAVDPADIRERYVKQVQAHLAALRRGCNDSDVEYHQLDVETPYDKALVSLLSRRR
jgi:uncharacterized protein (DUF58 family)